MTDYIFNADTKVDGVSTGSYSRFESSPYGSVIREVSFGPLFGGGGPNHFDIKNILVGTTGFGSSDLFSPALASMADFDAFFGSGADPTFSGGIISFNNVNDRWGVKDLGADYTDVYVQFDIRVYADDNDPDYHDIGLYSGDLASRDEWTGIYNGGGEWVFDGSPGGNFGTGPVQDGTTWTTVSVHWYFAPFVPSPPSITSFTPTSGTLGDYTIITGTGFSGTTDVQFNGVSSSAYWNVNSDTEIIAYVPTGATTGPLTVVNDSGSDTSSTDFTVIPPIVPVITSFHPVAGVIGAPVTINGTGFTGVYDVEFNGTYGSFTIVSDIKITTHVPTGATTGPISMTETGGTGTSDDDFTVLDPLTAPLIVFDGEKAFEIAT